MIAGKESLNALKSFLIPVRQTIEVFVPCSQWQGSNCFRDQFTTSHKRFHRLAHQSAEYQAVCPQFETFLITNNKTTSFLL